MSSVRIPAWVMVIILAVVAYQFYGGGLLNKYALVSPEIIFKEVKGLSSSIERANQNPTAASYIYAMGVLIIGILLLKHRRELLSFKGLWIVAIALILGIVFSGSFSHHAEHVQQNARPSDIIGFAILAMPFVLGYLIFGIRRPSPAVAYTAVGSVLAIILLFGEYEGDVGIGLQLLRAIS